MKKIIVLHFVLILTTQFTVLCQKPKLPPITPRWALEHIVWEDSLNTQNASQKLIEMYLEHKIPVGSIIIDSPWSTAYNNFEWDLNRYPNPTKMIESFSKNNIKVILWLTGCVNLSSKDVPQQKHKRFDEVIQKKYAVNNGETSTWWKGEGLHIDFTNPEAVKWWYSQLDKVLNQGIYGFKVDQGEIYFGKTVKTSIGDIPNSEFKPYYYNAMFQYITKNKSGGAIIGRPFSHQGGFAASVDQLSLGWSGDFEGSWDGLKTQISNIYKSAEFGYGAPGCEIGGFFRARSSKQELIRYAQFGALTASMINGGENGAFTNHLPWWHDEETTSIYRQATWLHSQLIPYIFSTIVRSSKEGGSLIKDFSYDQESHLLGDNIFTKAITSNNNKVTFILPESGKWVDFWTNDSFDGGSTISKNYSLSQFPLFMKSGSIIPLDIANEYSGIGNSSLKHKQTILILPNTSKTSYQYYRPLGEGIDYESIKISFNGKNNTIRVKGHNNLPYAFLIRNCSKPLDVENVDEWKYDDNNNELLIFKTGNSFKIKIDY